MNIKMVGVVGMLMSSFFLPAKAEQIPDTTLSVNFESGHIIGSGRHLNMLRVPVTDSDTGDVTFYDASFKFTFDLEKGLIFQQITSAAVSPPLFSVTSIIPGVYKKEGSSYCYILENPIALDANYSIFVFKSHSDKSGHCKHISDFSAQITSGLDINNPEFGHREIVPNLKKTFVYGIIAENDNYGEFTSYWGPHELIGLRQIADKLIVSLFSEGTGVNGQPADFKEPVRTVVLTKVPL